MRKSTLIKHIFGELDSPEAEEVFKWLEASPENQAYYKSLLKNLLASQVHNSSYLIDDSEMDNILERIKSHKPVPSLSQKHITVRKKHNWTTIAAIILLVLSLLGNLMQFDTNTKDNAKFARSFAKADAEKYYYTEKGVKGGIILPDGTSVKLNSASRISYPEHFGMDCRKVQLEGEAYFDVVKNAEWPMVVTTSKGMCITVTGTKFHVKSYENDNYEQATLFSGKISLTKKDNLSGNIVYSKDLSPMETVNISDKTPKKLVKVNLSTNADTAKVVAWKKGDLVFDKTSLEESFRMLERWHGCKIIIKDTTLNRLTLNARFTSESMVQIMNLLKFSCPINYSIVDKNTFVVWRLY